MHEFLHPYSNPSPLCHFVLHDHRTNSAGAPTGTSPYILGNRAKRGAPEDNKRKA